MPAQGASQASLAAQATAEGSLLAAALAKVRALPEAERPADADAWLRCEELQDDFKRLLAGWRGWPEDGRCEGSVRALCTLFAAVDAAPAGLEVGGRVGGRALLPCMASLACRLHPLVLPKPSVSCCLQGFSPAQDRDRWDTRLLGPALLPCPGGGRKRRRNAQLHRQIWGADHIRDAGSNVDGARPQPDDLLKWIGYGGWWLRCWLELVAAACPQLPLCLPRPSPAYPSPRPPACLPACLPACSLLLVLWVQGAAGWQVGV